MDLTSLLKKETILLPLEVQSKEECIDKMAESLVQSGSVKDKDIYVTAVLEREIKGSTGIGFGVAIPHGKSNGVAEPGLSFARLAKPIDWQSLDGSPVSMVFMIAVPEEQVGNEHLKILMAISRKLIHEDFRNQLLEAKESDEIVSILKSI